MGPTSQDTEGPGPAGHDPAGHDPAGSGRLPPDRPARSAGPARPAGLRTSVPAAVVALVLRTAIVLLALVGTNGVWLFLQVVPLVYFTTLATLGLLVVASWSILAQLRGRPGPPAGFRLVVTVASIVAGVVAWLLIEPESAAVGPMAFGLTYGQIVHQVLPLAATVDLVVLSRRGRLTVRAAALAAAVPTAYLAVVLVAAAALGVAPPYPFLDVRALGGAAVAGDVLVCLAVAVTAAAVLLAVDRFVPPLLPSGPDAGTSRGRRVR
ncbi:MAG: Pr6Pr family membrane protein [Actinobacteria bacterium]|nr:Pr6Pr family membrane protein [Actinomycetota bacterium]MCG2798894.1 Pr6Pr family membrane protein [Cellulomonas sp.]